MYIDQNTFETPKIVDAPACDISELSTSSRQNKLMPLGKKALKRSLGIPENAFVLCCLSKVYKLEPDLLQVFTHLLRTFPKTVLMLMGYPVEAQVNIQQYFNNKQIDINRIYFINSCNPIEQARLTLVADLYIDSAKICG